MSLKAWAGLLGEFGRQSEMYAKRQQELEDKQAEEERENRRMQALIAKEQGMELWKANRPLSEREQAVFDQASRKAEADIASTESTTRYNEARAAYYSGNTDEVTALAEEIAKERGITVEEALPLARAQVPMPGRRAAAGAASKSGSTGGALELSKADLFKDETIERGDTTTTVRTYLNGAKVPRYSEDEFVQMATERTDAWRKQRGKGLMNAEPGEEETAAYLAEQLKAIKEKNAADHKAAFEASKAQVAEFNAPAGLVAPKGGQQPQETEKKSNWSLDKIGLPNANATVDFEAMFLARDKVESNGKDFRADGKPVESRKGARYKAQVTPATAEDPGLPGVTPVNITNGMTEKEIAAEYNRVGDEYLSALVKRYDGNLAIAYAAYNAGFGRIDRWLENGADPDKLPTETKGYLNKIMPLYESYVSKKSNVLDDEQPTGTAQGGTGQQPQDDTAARVLARAEQLRQAAGGQKKAGAKEPVAVDTDPFGGLAMGAEAAGAGASQRQSLGTLAGKTAKAATEGGKAVGRGLLYMRDQGEKVGKLDWWKEQLSSLSDTVQASVAAAQERAGYNDEVLQMMYEEQAKNGKSLEEFIRDFLAAYGGADKTTRTGQQDRNPNAALGVRE